MALNPFSFSGMPDGMRAASVHELGTRKIAVSTLWILLALVLGQVAIVYVTCALSDMAVGDVSVMETRLLEQVARMEANPGHRATQTVLR